MAAAGTGTAIAYPYNYSVTSDKLAGRDCEEAVAGVEVDKLAGTQTRVGAALAMEEVATSPKKKSKPRLRKTKQGSNFTLAIMK